MVSNLHCLGQSLCRGNRLSRGNLSNVKDKNRVSTIERERGWGLCNNFDKKKKLSTKDCLNICEMSLYFDFM